jgi:hypothetical protein
MGPSLLIGIAQTIRTIHRTGDTERIVVAQMAAYSLAVYCASSLYVPGEEGMMEEFQVGYTPAAVGLAIYVLGYGFGPVSTYDVDEISRTSAD